VFAQMERSRGESDSHALGCDLAFSAFRSDTNFLARIASFSATCEEGEEETGG
jgi:hypothetical protein